MGVLTDLFQATACELAASFHGWKVPASPREPRPVADDDAFTAPDFRHLPWIDMKGLSPDMLEALGVELGAWTADGARGEISGRMLVGPADVEDCVFAIPDVLTRALADVGADRVAALAAAWSERERARDAAYAISLDVAEAMLVDLGDFAREARAAERDVFMWMSAG